ncbi:hypothetical protein [Bartonella tribocorum]|uniref:hypothetical protein n=1 Tax=Bartonella tribocorum TaxID=85701 RepID=UPI0015DD6F0E|nr:hypothetical protein [Bartonella tribocorum]
MLHCVLLSCGPFSLSDVFLEWLDEGSLRDGARVAGTFWLRGLEIRVARFKGDFLRL